MLKHVALAGAFTLSFVGLATFAQDQTGLQALQLQGPQYARLLLLDFGSLPPDKADHWFIQPSAPGRTLANYSAFIVLQPDTPAMQVCDVSHDYLDASRPAASCTLPPDIVPPSTAASTQIVVDSFGKMANVPLLKPLHADKRYIFSIQYSQQETLVITLSNATSLITPDQTKIRTRLKVKSTINLSAKVGEPVKVVRSVAKGPVAGTEEYEAEVNHIDDDGFVLALKKELPAGKSNPLQLEVKGLTDNYGTPVKVQSKIQGPPGAPTDVSNAFVTMQLSAIAAVHSTPTFGASGAVAPWHPAARMIWLPAGIFFDPCVNFDVGSANAKSSNSVIIPSQFSRAFVFGLPSDGKNIDPTTLVQISPAQPIGLNTSFGPRAEFDTQYGGVNLLGEARGQIYFTQLWKSVDVQKAVIASGNPAIRDLLELPTNGYSISPYLQVDAGGHVNSQTISNPSPHAPANVPTYDITRLYLGISGSFQLGRNTVNLDASYADLFLPETVPYTSNKVVHVTKISGWQPHAKLTYSFYFDEAKHFAGSIAWENGRTAPAFQYLNKVTVGLKVTY